MFLPFPNASHRITEDLCFLTHLKLLAAIDHVPLPLAHRLSHAENLVYWLYFACTKFSGFWLVLLSNGNNNKRRYHHMRSKSRKLKMSKAIAERKTNLLFSWEGDIMGAPWSIRRTLKGTELLRKDRHHWRSTCFRMLCYLQTCVSRKTRVTSSQPFRA